MNVIPDTVWKNSLEVDRELGERYGQRRVSWRGIMLSDIILPEVLVPLLFIKSNSTRPPHAPIYRFTNVAIHSLRDCIHHVFPYMDIQLIISEKETALILEHDGMHDFEGKIAVRMNNSNPVLLVAHREIEIYEKLLHIVNTWLNSILRVYTDKVNNSQRLNDLETLKEATRNDTPSNWYYGPTYVPDFIVNTTGTAISGFRGPLKHQILRMKEKISRQYGKNGVGGSRRKSRRIRKHRKSTHRKQK